MITSDVSAMPRETKEAIDRYVKDHLEPGGFLYAVLCNDLRGAVDEADGVNRHALFEIVKYLYNHCPSTCWGSEERVVAWLA